MLEQHTPVQNKSELHPPPPPVDHCEDCTHLHDSLLSMYQRVQILASIRPPEIKRFLSKSLDFTSSNFAFV